MDGNKMDTPQKGVKMFEPIKHRRIGCLCNKIQQVNIGNIFKSLDEEKGLKHLQHDGYINPKKIVKYFGFKKDNRLLTVQIFLISYGYS